MFPLDYPVLTRRPTKKIFKQFDLDGTATEDLDHWRDVFVKSMDPTEYSAAIELLGSWAEWQRFKREWPGFNKIIDEWKIEQEIYIRSTAIRAVVDDAKTKSKSAVGSARWLAEGGYIRKQAGRPSKEFKKRQQVIQERIATEVEDDIERVLQAHEIN